MATVAVSMLTASCSTQKKAQSDAAAFGESAVASRPAPSHNIDEQYLVLSEAQQQLIDKNNAFALKLFSGVSQLSSTVVSPISVTYLMGMLANGADGDTRNEIMKTIGADGVNIDEMNALYKSIMENGSKLDKATTIKIANYMAANKNISLKEGFTNTVKTNYMAGIESLDFTSSKSADKINNWCKKQTDGMIPSIIDNTDPNAVAYIMNAIFFNGAWTKKFNKSQTKDERFQGYTRNIQTVKMMHQENKLLYTNADDFAAVRLPYGNGEYAMTVMLPHDGKSIDDIMKGMTTEKLKQTQYAMLNCTVDLKLPRFTNEVETSLNEIIAKLGAPSIFNAGNANFSNMTDAAMSVSKMLQKAKIEVSEEGTKAAAVTAAIMTMSLQPDEPQKVTFHANKPFVYMITNRTTGAILFIGQFVGAE